MFFRPDSDDSTIQRLSFLKRKLEKLWISVERMTEEDEEGNQLLIWQAMERIDMLTNLQQHYMYN